MAFDKVKAGKLTIEVMVLSPEKVLNIFWANDISIFKVKKKNITTVRLEINYKDFEKVCEIVEKLGGKVQLVKESGAIFVLDTMKKKITLVVAAGVFLVVMYYLSTYVWAIEIQVGKNLPPFQVRKELESIGIKPGIRKSVIDVKDIEKKLENINSEILWLRVRVEGSTLKVVIEEKINPPTEVKNDYGNIVAMQDGEVQKVYTFSGRAVAKQGDMVKSGDVLIEGIDGMEGGEYITQPSGVVLANTFYEKQMVVKIDGTELVRSGKKDSDIFIKIFGKKIYLKKAIKGFEHYDRIEKSGKIFSEVLYYERVDKEVNITEDEAIKTASYQLEKSLLNDLTREASIVDKFITNSKDDKGNIVVKIVFVVQQNIVKDIPVSY